MKEMFSFLTQEIPEHQQADWHDSSGDKRINSDAMVVSFRTSLFCSTSLFVLVIIDRLLCQFVACHCRGDVCTWAHMLAYEV
jgi:hypothetical protein